MPGKEHKGIKQKQKMLILEKIFREETDEDHFLSMQEIIRKLEAAGVNADRKTLYADINELRDFGIDVVREKTGRNYYYHIGKREIEFRDLKLLADTVQSARFLTDRKSKDLVSTLEGLTSKYNAPKLNCEVYMTERIKVMSESIYFDVEKIHEAIAADCQICFLYSGWDIHGEMKPEREEEFFQISPWAVILDKETYYLMAYDSGEEQIRHFRIDEMRKISLTSDVREGFAEFRKLNMPRYVKSVFGRSEGDKAKITLEAENRMIGILADRFGKDIPVYPVDENHFKTIINAVPGLQFLGWIIALGPGVEVTGPEEVLRQMRTEISRLSGLYK